MRISLSALRGVQCFWKTFFACAVTYYLLVSVMLNLILHSIIYNLLQYEKPREVDYFMVILLFVLVLRRNLKCSVLHKL